MRIFKDGTEVIESFGEADVRALLANFDGDIKLQAGRKLVTDRIDTASVFDYDEPVTFYQVSEWGGPEVRCRRVESPFKHMPMISSDDYFGVYVGETSHGLNLMCNYSFWYGLEGITPLNPGDVYLDSEGFVKIMLFGGV